jgi:hypothetical protein
MPGMIPPLLNKNFEGRAKGECDNFTYLSDPDQLFVQKASPYFLSIVQPANSGTSDIKASSSLLQYKMISYLLFIF